ncbi:response regulator transcription factor [bacterium]|nr:response regulator transcription factor [bacterium]
MKKKNDDKYCILLVEDEEALAVGLTFNLEEEGYEVLHARDGNEALSMFSSENIDFIILDIMIPFKDGFEVAAVVRESKPQMPILMLTARTGILDKIKGLEVGADDYMTKPFHLKELLLRVKGMFRRSQWYIDASDAEPELVFGSNRVNFNTLMASNGTNEFQLTAREAMLLKYLADRQGVIVSRSEILENVWNLSGQLDTRTVDNFIMRLRKYFEPNHASPVYLKSVRSAGYVFNISNAD